MNKKKKLLILNFIYILHAGHLKAGSEELNANLIFVASSELAEEQFDPISDQTNRSNQPEKTSLVLGNEDHILAKTTYRLLSWFGYKNKRSDLIPTNTREKYTPHFQLLGDLLYWVPQVSALSSNFGTGSIAQTTTNNVTTSFLTEYDCDPHFKWNVGYRIGASYLFSSNPWEIDALWTYFQGSGYKEINHSKWRVKLNQGDLITAYSGIINSVCTLKPYLGLRGTIIIQKLFSEVVTNVIFTPPGTGTDSRTFNDKERFYGLGPLLGLNTNLKVGQGFSFYGTAATSLLYGAYHLSFNDKEIVTPEAVPSNLYFSLKKDMDAFDFNIDLTLGISWQIVIKDSARIITKLALENHQFFNQNRLGTNYGNLSFSGAIASLTLEF